MMTATTTNDEAGRPVPRGALTTSSYQKTVVQLPPLVQDRDDDGPLDSIASRPSFHRRRCQFISGILVLALLSFVASVGWFVVTDGGGGTGSSFLLFGGDDEEASLMGNPVERWAHLHPSQAAANNAVRAKESHGNKVKATTVIVIKEDHPCGDGDDCNHHEQQQQHHCHDNNKCKEEE